MANAHESISDELLDLYVKGKMSPQDRAQFEQTLTSNPNLKAEVALQKHIVQGLQKARALQLKQNLSQVQVGGSLSHGLTSNLSILSSSWKAVSGIVLASATIGLGSWYYFQNESTSTITHPEVVVEAPAIVAPMENTPLTSTSYSDETEGSLKKDQNKADAPLLAKEDQKRVPIATTPLQHRSSERSMPNIGQENSDFDIQTNNVANPEETSSAEATSKRETEISNVHDSKFTFHYQHFNHKLYLHGDFGAKPYELLEFNKGRESLLYLYHDHHYYEVKDDQTETVPLVKITDTTLKKALDKARIK